MNCRRCGHYNTRTTVTEHTQDQDGDEITKRYCRCLSCGFRFRTIERYQVRKRGPKKGSTRSGGIQTAGERNHNAVLTEGDVGRIRALVASGWKQRDVAQDYVVSPGCISRIVLRRAWKHVP